MGEAGDWNKARLVIRVIELVFSLIVFICACVWVDAIWYTDNNINFCLFTGLTSFLLGFFWILVLLKKSNDRGFLLINLALTVVYWIFWLSAAAASADTVSWVNGWFSVSSAACDAPTVAGINNDYCKAQGRKGAVRAVCAFSWLTWALISASLAFCIIEDIMRKKALNKSTGAAAPAPAEAAAPGTEAVAAAADAAAPEAAAKV